MAASSATVVFSTSAVTGLSNLSSHSAFSTVTVSVAPRTISARKESMLVRASASEEPRAGRREMVAGLIAAGTALATVGSAFAAAGPGQKGAKKTAKQADKLLKAADDLTNNDSPPRYGGERIEGSVKDASKTAQQAGSGAVAGLQDGAAKAIEKAKDNVAKAGDRLGDLYNKSS